MPAVTAAAGAAISSIGAAASAGLTAVGGLSGLATGISVASGAIGLVGAATGSKTLQKIGMFGGMVGGLGQGASMLSRAAGGASAAGSAASRASTAAAIGAKPFPTTGGAMATMGNVADTGILNTTAQNAAKGAGQLWLSDNAANTVTNTLGSVQQAAGAPGLSSAERIQDFLKRYDQTGYILPNIIGGLGAGYYDYQKYKIDQDMVGLARDKFDFEKSMYDTQQRNKAFVPTLGLKKANGGLLNVGNNLYQKN